MENPSDYLDFFLGKLSTVDSLQLTHKKYFADFKESHMLLYICSPVTRVSLNGWLIFTVSQERSAQDREALSRHSA